MPDSPRPRLVVEERGPSRVQLIMRTGLTGAHDRVLGELPAKLRPAFDVAVTLARAGIPSERWDEVVIAGVALVARDPTLRRLLEPRSPDASPESLSGADRVADRSPGVVGSTPNVGEPRSVGAQTGLGINGELVR